ncbi:glucosamine-6-phosphate deaminase [Corynebacterium ammoniagenes]|jgi:glucosamine-6-phosphate deaminase|uniref:Glucosamine-6-phosphate deaminase n=2 Tax=Corynebacterium ammoniagenes TaxID=1697 RepID=A0AAV5G9X9_CORAM|nr:glucosamine-6-phosphate deaminase [Corynebacterium ammoniagenes]APT83296.1 glucosamine-6-phosphate deaminase [Corynebacterium ammoniagenes DSM 20306]AQS74312.1 glucosamine-6-phosphate deaminase [Corynebacterium ammoniagenes]EFG81459.1 glucosamine-6-phosphate deaminase [Corynebacterium ammoniagenes DSM 20306]NMF32887.1 glucosamine-6-phosphate deaminase [Corynebacterium ammoniagenes]GJN43597.1 glucosamine-6-phosphate deaminase [Corynebacterium ammoniagenes]
MEILIRTNAASVATAAADIISDYAGRGATLGLATGSTPVAMYKELITRYQRGELSFSQCQAFLLDEYIGLPRGHEQSYFATIRREFTHHVDIDDARVYSPDGTAENPDEAGAAYDEAIAAAGGIDIQVLGVGTDGHIGFNEPGSSLSSGTRMKTLHASTISDNARFFDSTSAVPVHVLTQGLGTISRAGHLMLLATGSNKAEAVAALAEGPLSAICPASILQLHPHATVIVDEAAAEQLRHADYYRFTEANKPSWQGH